MKIDIITIFPDYYQGPLTTSILKRAQDQGHVQIDLHDLRQWTTDRHRTVDDRPYGGGAGMLMRAEPLFKAVDSLRQACSKVILLTPQGALFSQKKAEALTSCTHLIMICGHYEGVDERVREQLIDAEISVGDYVLTNGNLAALIVTDVVVRLLPGVLGSDESAVDESFSEGLLEYPQYTRPEEFRGMRVPEILLSGNHEKIAEWRREQSLQRTRERRPDLFEKLKKSSGGMPDASDH